MRETITKNRDLWAGSLLIVLSVAGYASTFIGRWSTSAGGGSTLFPRFAFIVVLLSGAAIVARTLRRGSEPVKLPELNLSFTIVAFVFPGIYVAALLRLGLAVSTFAALALVFLILSPDRRHVVKTALLPAFYVTAVVWVLFQYFMQIVLPTPLLF